ncbi:MAG: DUF99 family protein [Candidatus Aenigmatarchaeota archaeon]|nr:DUF99 family protein [Candidatus Aenigmarchaeota archaeon]
MIFILKTIKPEIRILAIDDGPFEFKRKGKDILIGVIFRGGEFIDGVLKEEIEIDGNDAEEKIIKMTNETKHKGQLRVLMLDGITFAGFNIVNIKNISEKTKLPVIVINRKKPNFDYFLKALAKINKYEKGMECVKAAGDVYLTKVKPLKDKRYGKVFYQFYGCTNDIAEKIIKLSSTRAFIPEPVRVAHLIATGIVLGESLGRA